jgi:hypothetical protein
MVRVWDCPWPCGMWHEYKEFNLIQSKAKEIWWYVANLKKSGIGLYYWRQILYGDSFMVLGIYSSAFRNLSNSDSSYQI